MGHLAAFGSGCEEGEAETPWQCGDPLEYQGYNYETVNRRAVLVCGKPSHRKL